MTLTKSPQTENNLLLNKLDKFQAIGVLHAIPFKDEEKGWAIDIKENRFRLFIGSKKYKLWLKQQELQPHKPLYLLVYPLVKLKPGQQQEIYFEVIAWNEQNHWGKPNHFIIRGIWELIPQLKIPVLSVYRNKGAVVQPNQRIKTNHLPVFMTRTDCKPYKFNPKLAPNEQSSKVFIEALFTFLPQRKVFGFLNGLAISDKIPARILKPKNKVSG